jgi:hypothetical protein
MERLFALSVAGKQHESFKKLYAKPEETFKRRRTAARKGQADGAKVFGLDCEMVITTSDDSIEDRAEYSLARASLVEFIVEKDEFVTTFDVFVKLPENRTVKDLLEHVSGISEERLKSAQHTLEDVIALLDEHIRPHDLIIGHSLWSDFEALKWWHDSFVDTSLFFKVQTAPRLTLGLKDAVVYTSGEVFQADGAHDPVLDAKYAVKVAKFLAEKSGGPFVELDDVPARFKKLLTFHNFETGQDDLRDCLKSIAQRYGASIGKPLKTVTNKDGIETGSITYEFPDAQAALKALAALPGNLDTNHPDGFPDQAGFLRKYVDFGDKPALKGEIISYHRADLDKTMQWTCSKQNIGRIMGAKGVRILHIQRTCGVQITNVQKDSKQVVFTIKSDDDEKCKQASKLLSKAEQGDDLGV